MSRNALIKSTRAIIEAYNEKDWAEARKLLPEGVVYDEISTNRKMKGPEEIVTGWQGWAKALPDSKATFEDPVVEGDVVVQPLRWRGTHSGPLALPSGEVLPTGEKIDLRACQIFHFKEGKVREMRHYFDMLTLLQQVGAAPEMKEKVRKPAR